MRRTLPIGVACLCILLIASCARQPESKIDGDLVLARFGDDVVTARDIVVTILRQKTHSENLLRLSVLGKVAQAIHKATPEIAYRKAVAAIARADGLDKTDSFRAWRKEIVNQKLGQLVLDVDTILKINVSDKDVERYYRENPSEFTQPETYKFRGIVCLDKKWGSREKVRERIRKALARLEAGDDFVEVAKEYSDSQPHLRGRPQGPVKRGDGLPVHIEEAVLSLATGEYTAIIEGEKGVAIYQLLDRTGSKKKELSPTLRWLVHAKVFEEQRRREERILVERLVERDRITYRPELLNDPSIPGDTVVLEVRGLSPVTLADIQEEMGPPDQMTTHERRDFFDARVASLLLLAESRRRGYTEEDVAARVEYLENEELTDRYVHSLLDQEEFSIDELRQFYRSHRDELVTEPEYTLYRIFIAAEIREDMSYFQRLLAFDRANTIAQNVYDRIAAEGIPFQDAARESSSDQVTAAEGGYVGRIRLSRLGPDFATLFEIAPQLELGIITTPQAANDDEDHLGYDIYHCAGVEPSLVLTFEEALPRIGRQLAEERRKECETALREKVLQAHPFLTDATAVEHLVQVLSEIGKSSPSSAELIEALLPRSRLKTLGL